jgi:hypothetical protein
VLARTIRRALVLAAITVCAAAPAAPAARFEPTGVTLKTNGFGSYHGRVLSDAPQCRRRKVGLYAVRPGRDGLLDFESSNAKGKWGFGTQVGPDTALQARVKARTVGGVRCAAGRSTVKTFR